MALGQPRSVRPHDQRDVRPRRPRSTEQVEQVGLAGRGVEQIVTPHDLLDALVVIVHHDGHVVGGHAIVPAQHDVVGGPRDLAVQPVEDRHRRTIGPQAQRRGPALSFAVPAAGRAQVAARSGVGPGPHVRRRARLSHLSPGAVARVGEAGRLQLGEGRLVGRAALGLPHDGPVPVEAQRHEIGELSRLVRSAARHGIEVLDAQQEADCRGSERRARRGAPCAGSPRGAGPTDWGRSVRRPPGDPRAWLDLWEICHCRHTAARRRMEAWRRAT